MKKEYIELFDRISPQSSNEEFLSQILGKAEIMEKKNKISMKKPVIAAFAAVFTLAAATVTVGAATGWDFNGGFDAVFKNRTERYSSEYQAYETGFDFAKYGKELDLHYTFDDYTLNIYGVIADESTAYVMYDVVFDEDFDYRTKKDYTDWLLYAELDTVVSSMRTFKCDLISAEQNRFTFYTCMTLEEKNTLVGNTLLLQFGWLQRGVINNNTKHGDSLYLEEEHLDCGVTVEIPVDFPVCGYEKYSFVDEISKPYLTEHIGGGKYVDIDAKLEKIELSALSCNFAFMTDVTEDEWDTGKSYRLTLENLTFIDNNGNEIPLSSTGYSNRFEENGRMFYHVRLISPIKPDEIVAVRFGELTVPLKNVDESEDFNFRKYGKELDLHYTFDDYTLNIHGVIADKSSAYVVYDVIFNEDYDYGEKEKYTPWDMIMIMETADRAMISNDNKLIKADNNRFTFYHMATSTKENPIEGNTLVLEFIRLERGIEQGIKYDELYSEVQTLNCELTVEIPVDFDICESVSPDISASDKKAYLIDYVNNESVKVEAKLEKIEISPLSCEFVFMTDIADDGLVKGEAYTLDEFFFTDKNGEIISCTPYDYLIGVEESGIMRFNVNLNQPIEPDEICSVTVGGTTIEIE